MSRRAGCGERIRRSLREGLGGVLGRVWAKIERAGFLGVGRDLRGCQVLQGKQRDLWGCDDGEEKEEQEEQEEESWLLCHVHSRTCNSLEEGPTSASY